MANKTFQLKRRTTKYESLQVALAQMSGATISEGELFVGYYQSGGKDHAVLGVGGVSGTPKLFFFDGPEIESQIDAAITELIGTAEKYQTLGALEHAIDELSGNTAGYSITEVTENVPVEVKKRYQLSKTVGSTTTKEGEYIDIPKDSHIVSINYIKDPEDPHYQNLEYTYINASGGTSTTYVDMSELVIEAEAGSGITATNHVLHGVVDPASESFLTVGADGFKLSGVQNAIDNAAASATTVVAEGTDDGNNLSIVDTVGGDGHKIFTINLTDVASAQGLADEIATRKAIEGQSGSTYSSNSGANYIADATSLNDADTKLDSQIKTNADAIAGINTAIEGMDADLSGNTTHVTVGVKEVNGKITAVTVAEDDIASAAALTGETAARKAVTGIDSDIYVKNTSANYISGATSMNNADVLLDTQVKTNADKIAALENAKVSVSASTETESAKYLSVATNSSQTVYTVQISGIDSAITTAINALDVTDTAVANQFVTSVSEADGKITVARAQVAASGVTATAITGNTTHVAVSGTNVADQIDSISQTLKTQANAALTGVTSGNSAIQVGAKSSNSQAISLVVNNTGASADLLSIDATNGLTISDVYDCGSW